MSVQEIENAITKLSNDELAKLLEWLADYQANLWDKQIEQDANSGRLDRWLKEVDAEIQAGKAQPL